jgi:hypothetical protein
MPSRRRSKTPQEMQGTSSAGPFVAENENSDRPRRAEDQQIAPAAFPPIQRVPPDDPRHAKRIGPIGEQMHQPAAGKTERERRKRMMLERAI